MEITRKHGYENWAEDLRNLSKELLQLLADKEDVFLSLGQQIQEVSQEAKELSREAQKLAVLVCEGKLQTTIPELEKEVNNLLTQFEKDKQADGAGLESLGSALQELDKLMGDFSRIVRRLRVLAISTRIESARLGTTGYSFAALADDVESLAGKTKELSSEISNSIEKLYEQVSLARDKSQQIEKMHQDEIAEILKRIESRLQGLIQMRDNSEVMAKNFSQQSEHISNYLGELVSSLQFHDIIRQQVEHVCNVLEETAQLIEEHQAGKNSLETTEDIISWVGEVCRLQASQLSASKQEFIQALDRFQSNLGEIASAIEQGQGIVGNFLSGGESDGQSVLSLMEEDVRQSLDPLRKAKQESEHVANILISLADTVAQMETFVRKVEEVGSEIELVSLNASVRSAHTGEKGRAMGVLAEAIHQLSREARMHASSVNSALHEISTNATELRSEAENTQEASKKEEEFAINLSETLEILQEMNATIQRQLESMHKRIDELKSGIKYTQVKELGTEEVSEGVEAARAKLLKITEDVQDLVPYPEKQKHSNRLKRLLERYTMESERLIHTEFSASSSEDHSDDPDLWMTEDAEDQAESEFGDNVELF